MIAIDAMGGDFAPQSIVEGAYRAAKRGIHVRLYGNEHEIMRHLIALDSAFHTLPITIIHCEQLISMDDEPVSAFLRKKDTSIMHALRDVQEGVADAFVSAGNTGACLVGGMMEVGKLNGILRPAIGECIPTLSGSAFFIDLGANVDCKPEQLLHFAFMGTAYVMAKKNINTPRVALLANGIESTKGNKIVLAAHELLKSSGLHFIGNREPIDILNGDADVVVCDGFTGNIMLKSLEAMVSLAPKVVDKEIKKRWWGKWFGFLGKRFLTSFKKNVARVQKGGALLLGLKKPIIIAHGASLAPAIEDAILYADMIAKTHFIQRFNGNVEGLIEAFNQNKLYQPLQSTPTISRAEH